MGKYQGSLLESASIIDTFSNARMQLQLKNKIFMQMKALEFQWIVELESYSTGNHLQWSLKTFV